MKCRKHILIWTNKNQTPQTVNKVIIKNVSWTDVNLEFNLLAQHIYNLKI